MIYISLDEVIAYHRYDIVQGPKKPMGTVSTSHL